MLAFILILLIPLDQHSTWVLKVVPIASFCYIQYKGLNAIHARIKIISRIIRALLY